MSVHAGEITLEVTFVVSALLNFRLHQETPKCALFVTSLWLTSVKLVPLLLELPIFKGLLYNFTSSLNLFLGIVFVSCCRKVFFSCLLFYMDVNHKFWGWLVWGFFAFEVSEVGFSHTELLKKKKRKKRRCPVLC